MFQKFLGKWIRALSKPLENTLPEFDANLAKHEHVYIERMSRHTSGHDDERSRSNGTERLIRCHSAYCGVRERNVSYFITLLRLILSRYRTLARVRECIEHSDEICRMSLGCILARDSLFFFSSFSFSLVSSYSSICARSAELPVRNPNED